jgi:hypothetical protein
MYILYVLLAVVVVVGLVKFWPLIASKIPKSGPSLGGGMSDGLAGPPPSSDSIYG